ncbi:MAG: anthranilate synthase component I [Planctomycetota bacterium]
MYYPSFQDFRRLAKTGNAVPVYRQLLGDSLTPVLAYARLATRDYAFLLESVIGGEKIARYSFLGTDPYLIFRYADGEIEIQRAGRLRRMRSADPLAALGKLIREVRAVHLAELPRFTGGAVGYAAYDMVRTVEELPGPGKDTLHLPDLYFCFYDSIVLFDHIKRIVRVVAYAHVNGSPLRKAYDDALARIDRITEKLKAGPTYVADDIDSRDVSARPFASTFRKRTFENAVRKCKRYIEAGDIFQVVLSQRLSTPTSTDPWNIYRVLRTINPSPYMFFLKFAGLSLVGSSPEVMVKVEEGKVTLRPIAGTRPRGRTEEEDLALAEELLADPKERAEHIMLVDLGRNDVGRVAKYGTVRVDEKMVIERYSHVMHITSNVVGILRDDSSVIETLRACLPAGTVSGAPKVRAMEIIDELEPTKRGPYAGAVGYIDFGGNMDTCITIRTILVKDRVAYVQAGAGIVADSVPDREYEETLNKARGLLKAIDVAEKCFPSRTAKRRKARR